jgi:hypothetical protein
VAPHPTRATRAMASLRWPSGPMPGKSTCREYLSSVSKVVTSSGGRSHYYRCRPVARAKCNTARHFFIEPTMTRTSEEPVCV